VFSLVKIKKSEDCVGDEMGVIFIGTKLIVGATSVCPRLVER